MEIINISTPKRECFIDITDKIHKIIRDNNFKDGVLTIFTPHTTAAITINENADPDVVLDMTNFLNNLIPNLPSFNHYEGNSDAHIKSSLIGCSEMVILEEGRLVLGTWQGIYFCEFDGPRNRKVYLKFM
jgi:secondary thiamine-phosphate synthase enzyme